jgi:hypothetical protein
VDSHRIQNATSSTAEKTKNTGSKLAPSVRCIRLAGSGFVSSRFVVAAIFIPRMIATQASCFAVTVAWGSHHDSPSPPPSHQLLCHSLAYPLIDVFIDLAASIESASFIESANALSLELPTCDHP